MVSIVIMGADPGLHKEGLGGGAQEISGVWFDKSKNPEKLGSGPGSTFGLEDKAPWTS